MIRTAFDQGGELSAAVELRRLFPGITDNAHARGRPDHRWLEAAARDPAPGDGACAPAGVARAASSPGGSFGSFGRAYHLGALRVCQRGSRIPTCHIGDFCDKVFVAAI